MWSRSVTEIENVDIICFGHLLYEMCTGQELTTPKPSMRVLEMELQHYPQIGQVRVGINYNYMYMIINYYYFLQVLEILGLIFEPPSGVCPSVEDLVLCDLFRSIDLRELRGPCFSVSTGYNRVFFRYVFGIFILNFRQSSRASAVPH